MKIYQGRNNHEPGCTVFVNGDPLAGGEFAWGLQGEGYPVLAQAILAECLGEEMARRYSLAFSEEVVSKLPMGDWTLTEREVVQAVERIKITKGVSKG